MGRLIQRTSTGSNGLFTRRYRACLVAALYFAIVKLHDNMGSGHPRRFTHFKSFFLVEISMFLYSVSQQAEEHRQLATGRCR